MWNSAYKPQVYYIASAAFLIISFIFIFLWKSQPYISLDITSQNGQWVVVACDLNSEGYRSGIRIGDIILSIDHGEVGNFQNIRKWNQAEGASSIEFRKPGQLDSITVNIHKKDAVSNILSKLPLFILGFTFWVISFMTWRKRPFLVQARAMFWLNLCIGLAINISPASCSGIPFAREAEYSVFTLVPLLLVNFFSFIPVENKSVIIRLTKVFFLLSYVVMLSLLVLHLLYNIYITFFIRKYILVIVTLGVFYVLTYLILITRHKDVKIKNQALILLSGTVLGFFPAIIFITIPTVFNVPYAKNLEVGSLFIAFIPVTWYFVIINEYLPNSRKMYVKVISFLSAAFVSSILLTLALLYLNIFPSLTISIFLMIVSLTIIVMFCFLMLTEVSLRLLEKCNIYESERTLNKKILQLTDSLALLDDYELFEKMMRALKIKGIFFVAENKNQSLGYVKRPVGVFSDDMTAQENMAAYFEANKFLFEGTEERREAIVLTEDVSAAVYIPFVSEDHKCGIFLGHHYSNNKYEQYELNFITLIAKQMAHRFLASSKIKDLSQEIKELDRKLKFEGKRNKRFQWMPGFFYDNIEKERKSLAEEIHAGPLQLGLDLSRWLKALAEEPHGIPDDKTAQIMAHMRKIIDQLNYELRQTCNNLRPPTLTQLGLLSAVEILCEYMITRESLLVSLKWEGMERDDRFPEEVEIAAYRFIQEGLTNAKKHAGVGSIQISLAHSGNCLILTVADKGKGFDTNKIGDWLLEGIHLGLIVIKEQIESMGGSLQINSKIGKGTTLKAAIPVE